MHSEISTYPSSTMQVSIPISNKVLMDLLSNIKAIDFVALIRQQAGEDMTAGIKQKHYVVCIIQHIVEQAERASLGLCQRHDFIYAYNGELWEVVEREELKTFLGLAAVKMGYSWIEAKHYEFKDKLYKQFLSATHLKQPITDSATVLVNLKNGTLEITPEGHLLRGHRKEDFLTYQLPFSYDKSATCPIFNRYLHTVQNESECQDILAEFVAYAFTRHLKLEKCLLLYGDGANGKSVFFEVVNALLGRQNISTLSLGHLKEEHNRALLVNKLLNYGSEINGGALEADLLKQLISGEPVQARLKYGNPFVMESYAKLAFNCNTLPQVIEHSEAFYRRFLIVPFDVIIPESDRNPNLASDIIKAELAGVFNWVLSGLDRLLSTSKFTVSPKVNDTIQAYRTASDTVALFLNEKEIEPSYSGEMKFGEVYDKYRTFCGSDGYRPVSKKTFSDRLKKLGFETMRRSAGVMLYASYKPTFEIPDFREQIERYAA